MRLSIPAAAIVLVALLSPLGSAAPDELSTQEEARLEQCRKKLIAMQKLGGLYDLDWTPTLRTPEPRVVVGPTFLSLPIDAKQAFVENVNCFLMAGRNKYVNFDVLHWQTGNRVGRYSYGKYRHD